MAGGPGRATPRDVELRASEAQAAAQVDAGGLQPQGKQLQRAQAQVCTQGCGALHLIRNLFLDSHMPSQRSLTAQTPRPTQLPGSVWTRAYGDCGRNQGDALRAVGSLSTQGSPRHGVWHTRSFYDGPRQPAWCRPGGAGGGAHCASAGASPAGCCFQRSRA